MNKERVALISVGVVVVAGLGYLIYKHEQSTAPATAAAADDASTDAALEQESLVESLPNYASAGGYEETGSETSTSSQSDLETTPTDSNIAAILAAFYPAADGSTTTPTTTPPTTTTTAPPSTVTPQPVPVGTPPGVFTPTPIGIASPVASVPKPILATKTTPVSTASSVVASIPAKLKAVVSNL